MNLHPTILALILTLCAATATTQNSAVLSGQVIHQSQPLEFAEVLLLSDSSELIAHTTVMDGFFQFEAVPPNSYQIRTIALGYLEDERTIVLNENQAINIQLTPDEAFLLDEIIVKEKRERFTNEGGNLRMNVAQTALAASNNTLDLLSKLPGAILSSDRESVTIIGQGSPLIYLNNQQISLSEFSAIPVSDIQDIELINNPSARYEANGRVVLLVRLKRQRAEGYRIELANNVARKQGWNNNLTANANWNKDKWTGTLNLGYQRQQPWEQVESEFSLLDQPFASTYQATVFGNRNVYILGGGLAYQKNSNTTLSLRFNTRIRDGQGDATTFSSLQQNAQQNEFVTATDQDDHRHN
ncbi:MAG: carboxypeptidase-like regulatory domain-containing protein, partial [Bacteroidota bacterium]